MRSLFTLLVISFFISIQLVNAQPDTAWTRVYGGSGYDLGKCVRQTSDKCFVIVGTIDAYYDYIKDSTKYFQSKLFLAKIDTNGNKIWEKYFSEYNIGYNAVSVEQTNDGGFIITGDIYSKTPGYKAAVLIKTDGNGVEIWRKQFETQGSVKACKETYDGGYIFLVSTFLAKLNSTGDVIWQKSYFGNFIEPTNDNGFIILDTHLISARQGVKNLYKIDKDGNVIWTKALSSYIPVIGYLSISSFKITDDNGYVFTGIASGSYFSGMYPFLLKTDSEINLSWIRYYIEGSGKDVIQSIDGSFIFAEFSTWSILEKISSNGEVIWSFALEPPETYEGCSVQETHDGGYIVLGNIVKTPGYEYDIILIRCKPYNDSLFDITYPKGGEVWMANSKPKITWKNHKKGTFVNIDFSISSGL